MNITHYNAWMVLFAMFLRKGTNAVNPTKDVKNAPKMVSLCALIKNVKEIIVVKSSLMNAISMAACDPAVCINKHVSNR